MKKIIAVLPFFFLIIILSAQVDYPVSFPHDGKNVFGTLTVPDGTSPFPLIIINPGTGAVDRNGTVMLNDGNSACLFPELFGDTLRIYRDLAVALVDSGYAVLRYDKLEYTYPTTLGTITFHKLWLPVESAINYVKTRTDIDTNRIILIGHSEGSSLIPYIAEKRTDIRALISIAGPRTPFDSLLAYQYLHLVHLLRPCGATDADSLQAMILANQILNYFNIIRTDSWNAGTPPLFGVPAAAWFDYVRATDSVAVRYNRAGLPTLFTGMGLDIQVPPSELERFMQEISVTDDFWTLPELLHYMTPDDDPHVSMALTDTIIYWLRQQDLNTAVRDPDNGRKDIIQVSPNPFTSTIGIQSGVFNFKHAKINVCDLAGQLMASFSAEDLSTDQTIRFDLSFLPRGMYFIEIRNDETRITRTIVKQ